MNNGRKNNILDSEQTLQILREIEANQHATQRDLSQKLTISLGKINFFINAFIDKGLIKITKFKNDNNKFGYLYILTPRGIKTKIQLTCKFYLRKSAEYEMLKQEMENFKQDKNLTKEMV